MFKIKITEIDWSIIFLTVVLCIGVGISIILNPEVNSLEPFMLVAVTAMLAGIWQELRRMNHHRHDSDKQTNPETNNL